MAGIQCCLKMSCFVLVGVVAFDAFGGDLALAAGHGGSSSDYDGGQKDEQAKHHRSGIKYARSDYTFISFDTLREKNEKKEKKVKKDTRCIANILYYNSCFIPYCPNGRR